MQDAKARGKKTAKYCSNQGVVKSKVEEVVAEEAKLINPDCQILRFAKYFTALI